MLYKCCSILYNPQTSLQQTMPHDCGYFLCTFILFTSPCADINLKLYIPTDITTISTEPLDNRNVDVDMHSFFCFIFL